MEGNERIRHPQQRSVAEAPWRRRHLPLPGDHAQHHHQQRERLIGDVPGV